MGQRIETWQGGVMISVDDDRVFEEEQSRLLVELKEKLEAELRNSDWYLIREQDQPSKQIPQSVRSARTTLRSSIDAVEAAIKAATNLAELDAVAGLDAIEPASRGLGDAMKSDRAKDTGQ